MKTKYSVLKYIILIVIGILVFLFSTWPQVVINLVLINILIYILRKPLKALAAYIFKKRFYKAIVSVTINIVWSSFMLALLWFVSDDLFLALLPFIILAVSLNFKNIVNNIASGLLLLASEPFEIGDLIETNDVQGIVKEINLNFTKIKEFDGVDIVLQNSNIYGSTIIKFTHSKYKILKKMKKEDFEKKKYYRRYMKQINKIMRSKIKTTKYLKQIEIPGTIDPKKVLESISKIFDIYEPIFGIRPNYSVDMTRYSRVRINLYIMSEKPNLVINFIDSFLRDLIYEFHSEEIYRGWEDYKKKKASKSKGGEK
jgi:small-conductance mechanosensitive channel